MNNPENSTIKQTIQNHRPEQAPSRRPSASQRAEEALGVGHHSKVSPHCTPSLRRNHRAPQGLCTWGARWEHKQCSHLRRVWRCLRKLSVHLLPCAAMALPGAYPREIKMPVHTDVYSSFTSNSQICKQPSVHPQMPGLVTLGMFL